MASQAEQTCTAGVQALHQLCQRICCTKCRRGPCLWPLTVPMCSRGPRLWLLNPSPRSVVIQMVQGHLLCQMHEVSKLRGC